MWVGSPSSGKLSFCLVLKFFRDFSGIGADAKDDNVLLIEFWFQITKFAGFDGAARRAGFGIEIKKDALAFEILQRNLFAFVGNESEVWSFVADLQHEKASFSGNVILRKFVAGLKTGHYIGYYDKSLRRIAVTVCGLA